MNIKVFTTLLSAVFWLCAYSAYAQSDDKKMGLSIQQVWNNSHELETFLGIASLVTISGDSQIECVSRDITLRRAKVAARNLEAGLRVLSKLNRKATPREKLAIDGLELVSYGRIRALSVIIASPDGGVMPIVTSCLGAWNCLGFGAGYKELGGKLES
ncbi:MAG: hypothetical protein ACJASL_003166 [Paraglaciecola sp.]|jgi:hypothetical protein